MVVEKNSIIHLHHKNFQGSLIEVHVCKLMIIIDHSHDDIPKKTLLHLIEPTFSSMLESLTKNDPVMLRLVVDFFVDMATNENSDVLKEYQHYNEQLSRILQVSEKKTLKKYLHLPVYYFI